MRKFVLLSIALAAASFSACAKDMPEVKAAPLKDQVVKLTFKEIVSQYYKGRSLYVGIANHYKLKGTKSFEIMEQEFSYITPTNDFKQSAIHPMPGRWRWDSSDGWIEHSKAAGAVLRIHGPISPQSSKWALDDSRTAAEMSQNLDEFMIGLCKRYSQEPAVKWMDVVNETIAVEKFDGYQPGDWFGPRTGVDKWENPWPILGYDSRTSLNVPIYIDRAFELANMYAPNVKQIINQHGDFEAVVWEKMKMLYTYLTETKGRRVDGIGWQAHIDMGWEKIPGNLERLSAFIDWCHARHLEFHITEMNVWLKDANAGNYAAQADTYEAVVKLLLSKLNTGTIGLNFWTVRDEDSMHADWQGSLWNNDGTPKPAVQRLKNLLIKHGNLKN